MNSAMNGKGHFEMFLYLSEPEQCGAVDTRTLSVVAARTRVSCSVHVRLQPTSLPRVNVQDEFTNGRVQ